jgi:hypothetical protein
MARENQLSYYSAKLLKDALVELGYTEVKYIKNKKELIEYITILIQCEGDDEYDSESDDDYYEEPITIDASNILEKLKKI